jgi:hypothetical protein
MRFASLLLLCACHSAPFAPSDAGADGHPVPFISPRPDAGRLKSSQPGHLHREDNFIDGTGIITSIVDNTTTGQADITISSTVTGGVSSVTASGSGITASPTTGAVVIANTGVTSNVAGTGIGVSGATGAVTISNTGVTSNVAGTGIAVSGATGAVTVSLSTPVSVANGGTGDTALTAHGVLLGQTTSNVTVAGPCSTAGQVLTCQGLSADPSFTPVAVVSALGLNSGVAIGAAGTHVTLGSKAITVPSGLTVIVLIAFQIATTSTTGSDFTIGLGIDSTTYTISQTLTCPPNISGSSGIAFAPMFTTAALSAGSHTFNAVASSTGSTGTGAATVLLFLSQ